VPTCAAAHVTDGVVKGDGGGKAGRECAAGDDIRHVQGGLLGVAGMKQVRHLASLELASSGQQAVGGA
jgi:hypothetical protein